MPPKSRGFLTAPVLYCIIVCCVVFTFVHTCYLTSFSQWRSIYTLSELCYIDIVPWRHVLFICMCTSPAYRSACPPFSLPPNSCEISCAMFILPIGSGRFGFKGYGCLKCIYTVDVLIYVTHCKLRNCCLIFCCLILILFLECYFKAS